MRFLAAILLLFYLNANAFSQLDKSKEEIKSGNSKESDKNSSGSSSASGDENSSENFFSELALRAFLYLTYYSFIGNYADEAHLHNNLTASPYCDNISGNYINTDTALHTKSIMRFDVNERILLGTNDLYGNHLNIKLRPFQYFYFKLDYFQLIEYNATRHNYAQLSLFNFNFCYDRIRFDNLNIGWTLGASYIGNEVKKGGPNFGFNAEWFIYKPISVGSSVKWGSINQQDVDEFEIQFRYHKKTYLLEFGYEHLKIATPSYDFISCGGSIFF